MGIVGTISVVESLVVHTVKQENKNKHKHRHKPDGAGGDLQDGADEVGDPRERGDLFKGGKALEVRSSDGDFLVCGNGFVDSGPNTARGECGWVRRGKVNNINGRKYAVKNFTRSKGK